MNRDALTKGILGSFVEGGGCIDKLPEKLATLLNDDSPKFPMADVVRATEHVENKADLLFVLDHLIWFSLTWEVGDAVLQRLFELGHRDPHFLGCCKTFYLGLGPEGDDTLLDLMERLDEEGASNLKRYLDSPLLDSAKECRATRQLR